MSNQADPQTKLASVDLDQWRQEIDVFAGATAAALDAIVSELSNACSGDGVPAVSPRRQNTSIARRVPVSKQAQDNAAVKRASAALSSVNTSTSASNGNTRLASIKEKLASRMNKGQ